MLGGRAGPGWEPQVRAIYSPERIVETFARRGRFALVGQGARNVIQLFRARFNRRADHRPRNERRAAITDPENRRRLRSARLSDSGRTA